jgi:hypothetical protein
LGEHRNWARVKSTRSTGLGSLCPFLGCQVVITSPVAKEI